MSNKSKLEGDWDALLSVLAKSPIKKAIELTCNRVGIAAAAAVKKGIRDGAPGGKKFAPLSDFTKARKGSTKPLIDNGDLLGSISHQVLSSNEVWVGALRGTRTKDGKDIVDIAAVHEFGATIKVTPKMRGYLHSQGLHLAASTQYIHIPERSYLRATFESPEFKQEILDIAEDTIGAVFKP